MQLVGPPPRLILRALKKMQNEKAFGTIILPQWRSSPFWSELVNEEGLFKSVVKGSEILLQQEVITQNRGKLGIFSESPLKFTLIALCISFRSQSGKDENK